MIRYFLHQRGGASEFEDDEGIDLADLEAARAEAIAGIRGILADMVLQGRLPLNERIEIADGSGRTLASVNFAEAVQVDG